jgi:tetratricopeptide (TPR) repeat protein
MKKNTNSYYFNNSGHLTDEAVAQSVEAMLNISLHSEMPEKVAGHLSGCEQCNERVTGLYMDLKDEPDIIMILAGAVAKPKTEQAIRRPLAKIAALVLLLIAGAGAIILLQKPSPDKLFSDYFEAYPNIITVKSNATNTLSTALLYYELKDYDSAIILLEKYLNENDADPAAGFYAGVASLANGQADEAIVRLKQVIEEKNKFSHPAKWYLALAYLKNKDPSTSLQYLQSLIETDDFYRDKSNQLMKKIR